jgi:hypothetical protein
MKRNKTALTHNNFMHFQRMMIGEKNQKKITTAGIHSYIILDISDCQRFRK